MTPKEAIALQKELASQVRIAPLGRRVHTVAGVDCAFIGKEKIIAVASGEKTKSELAGVGDEEFAPWQLGPTF